MKKAILILAGVLLLASCALGQVPKGKMMATAYGGYSFGFGDAFKDFDYYYGKTSSSAGINFGGIFNYFVNDKFAVGGEIFVQHYGWKNEYTTYYGGYGVGNYSGGDTKANFLFNGLYPLNYSEEKAMYIMAGAGVYDSDFGINGGLAYFKQLSPNIDLYIAPRFHIIFSSASAMLLQLSAGASFAIGSTK